MILPDFSKKISVVIFDLDGTLAESKQPLDEEMADLLSRLLEAKLVAVMSGASFPQFEQQFLTSLNKALPNLNNLYLSPTSGARLYSNKDGDWQAVYFEELTVEEKDKIMKAFDRALAESGVVVEAESYGPIFEDRGSQITFSARGQEAPSVVKNVWDPDQKKRQNIALILKELLPEFSVKIGGSTSIDITKKGVDKAYGLGRLLAHLGLGLDEALYVGDALYPGGNDEPILGSGAPCCPVGGVSETKDLIRKILDFSK